MMPVMKIHSPGRKRDPARGAIETEVAPIVAELQRALSEVVFALAQPIRGGTGIQNELGLPTTLSWQINAFLQARDPMTAIDHIPGRQASKRALAAAAEKGAPQVALDRASAAFERFEECVERHSGNRAAFASMVSGLTASDSSVDFKARRDMFRAASRIYGVQLETLVNCAILHPGKTPERFDYLYVTASLGMQVTRPFEKLFVGRHRSKADKPMAGLADSRPVIDDGQEGTAGPRWRIPLVEEFSSLRLPSFSTEIGLDGMHEIYVSGQPVGRTGVFTYVLAQYWRGAVPRDEVRHFDTTHLYPAEHVVHDILLGPDVSPRETTPKTGVYGGSLHEIRARYRDVDALNVPATTQFVGEGVETLRTTRWPRYVELLRLVCEKMGWQADSFDAYRCEVEYPVLHSLLNTTFPGTGRLGG
jgi:hypothetical protein